MTDTQAPLIYWFRQDLRLNDLPGLRAAAATGRPVLPCYCLDTSTPRDWAPGAASRWWLHHSLDALAAGIERLGGTLLFVRGDSHEALLALAEETAAAGIYCSRDYEPWSTALERELNKSCVDRGLEFRRYPGRLLFEPEDICTQGGGPFKVFTPFWKACLRQPEPREPRSAPDDIHWYVPAAEIDPGGQRTTLHALELRPDKPNWAESWDELWTPGERGAEQRLQEFLASGLEDYSEGRNHPARDATSRLSAHMHFGEISPHRLWQAARGVDPRLSDQVEKFLSELGWREFSHHLLHHFPEIPHAPFKPAFADFPWLGNQQALRAWQLGRTGYPIVDAGMRELWQTGYMHNRVRMIVASFLTKHLLLPWRMGEDWFWDTLVDADLANNACGWQWVAGSGADASPYFRIFNPTLQGEKFDRDGDYVRHWVPELQALPNRYLHEPTKAPAEVLEQAGVTLGDTYPMPIVDHREAREAALAAYAQVRSGKAD